MLRMICQRGEETGLSQGQFKVKSDLKSTGCGWIQGHEVTFKLIPEHGRPMRERAE